MLRHCPHCPKPLHKSDSRTQIVRLGFFHRKSDQRRIQRLKCKFCRHTFSFASSDPCYFQKRRDLNSKVFQLLSSGVSMRRISYLLKTNRKTVYRKFLFIGKRSILSLRKSNLSYPKCAQIEFDDLETFEHTKCKPLSVTLAVEHKSRRILGFSVSSMPCKGRLATKSVKKYGPRFDDRTRGRRLLFHFLKGVVQENSIIRSDQNPHYTNDVKTFFPKAKHLQFKGQRGADTGQGELKKIIFDPLFSLNHTCAKLRADVNRLIRKTWCTTKKTENLRYHLALFSVYHNQALISPKKV
jgi:transposase-like protein